MSKVIIIWSQEGTIDRASVCDDEDQAVERLKDLLTGGLPTEQIAVYRSDDGHSVKVSIDK